jgi:hypothetical protein
MKLRNSAAATLLLLTTCSGTDPGSSPRIESSHLALGTVPATESATWTRIGAPSSPLPNPRYMQAAAVDEDRQVLVMFGGWSGVSSDSGYGATSQDVWEWNPATGAWTNRTPAGTKPSPRAGASMVYDSVHKNFVLFGGRSTSGFNYEDTWVWDPAGGTFTDATTAGPSARSQHSMVFEKSTGKVLLFGGGRADAGSSIWPETYFYSDPLQRPRSGASPDGTGIVLAFAETWEWDPSAGSWTQLTPTTTPGARYDSALVWDSKRNLAVLFGGMQKDQTDANGIPQRDTWDWNPTTKNWSLRASTTTMPSPRWGHAMAYDPARGLVVLAGGKSWQTYLGLGEVWDWDPNTGNWTQRLTGNESSVPAGRMYASLLTDSARSRLDLLAGITFSTSLPFGGYQPTASGEVWEFEPASAKFANRSAVQNWPSQRWGNAIAFCPATGKTYLFGGQSPNYDLLNDLWEWDGSSWSQVPGDVRPTRRANPAMAYDPSRKSLILFGGLTYPSAPYSEATLDLCDTWEWSSATRTWSQLSPASSPGCVGGAGMVTDSGRAKLLLFGGEGPSNAVWEWDGAKTTWTNRTPAPGAVTPGSRGGTEGGPLMAFDDGRQKMFLFEGDSTWQGTTSNSVFWEWDPLSAGWALRDSGDFVDLGTSPFPVVAYDSLRRRMVVPSNATDVVGSTTAIKTWELDSKGPTWYLRDLATGPSTVSVGPGSYSSNATMAFDSQRGVMVLFGAGPNDGSALSETWEYKVKSLGNGEGCTAATASNCASGFCVDGVCCSTASCSGVCQSCAVVGNQGTCALATPGTQVSGSCADGQACAAGGGCKAQNGTACSSANACASGVCADGVCCDSACDGTCVSCNQVGRMGKCSPFTAGSDPQNECGLGSGVCRSTCNGAGACDYPQAGIPCGPCQVCDGNGVCWLDSTPYLCNTGGNGGGGAGGTSGAGGTGGSIVGGAGGAGGVVTGGSGGSIMGGAGGVASGGLGGHAGTGGSAIGGTVLGGAGGAGGFASGGSAGHAGATAGGASGSTSPGGAGGLASGGSPGHAGATAGGASGSASPGGTGGLASGGSGGHAGATAGDAGGFADAGLSSPDAGRDSILPDAGRPDGSRDARRPDGGSPVRLGHKGCDCDLGQTPADGPGLPFALLGAVLFWRRARRRYSR